MSKIYSSIFLLNEINSITSLDTIFERNHRELLTHVEKHNDVVSNMPESEKYFLNTWEDVGEEGEITVPKIGASESFVEETIIYKKAIANVEYTKRKRFDEHGNFLPKNERVNTSEIESLFFEKGGKVYVLILTSNEYNINRVKNLIGIENISSLNSEYTLDPDMFNWLFYLYTERDGTLNQQTKLENISGFVGNVTDDANVFTGESHQTTELIVTKAFISNGGELKKIQLRIRDEDADVTCMINENSTVVLAPNLSSKLRLLDNIDNVLFLLLYLYGYLIIKIKKLYNDESERFIAEDNPSFSKSIGIEVIKSIVQKNNISLRDIEFCLSEPDNERDVQ